VEFPVALALVFLIGLLGGPHCALMCGPLAHPAIGGSGWARAAYHLGRLATYLMLGALASLVGEAFWQALKSVLPGLLAAALFVGAYFVLIALTSSEGGYPARVRRVLRPWADTWGRRGSAWSLGLATGLLPCGWLYTFVLAASSFPSPLQAAALMAAFWLSTVPWVDAAGRLLAQGGRAWLHHPAARALFLLLSLGLGLGLKFSDVHLGAWPGRVVLDSVARPDGLERQGAAAQELICR
jgi:hypothetical protein